MNHATVHPSKIRLHSDTLGCDLLSTIGYRAQCGCGWRGPYRQSYKAARDDIRAHKHDGARRE